MTNTIAPLQQVTASAIQLLCREIGVVNTLRFLNQFSPGYGDYTKDRDSLFGNMTVDEIASEITRRREEQRTSASLQDNI